MASPDPSLILAVLQRDLPAIRRLLRRPHPPPLTYLCGFDVFHAAALVDCAEAVPLLLQAEGARGHAGP